MQALNFPDYRFRLKNSENKVWIFDEIRKKFLVLQPEEWVRQHVVRYLMESKGYPKSLIQVEKVLTLNTLKKRYDVVVYKPDGNIAILVECKSPGVTINQGTFDQIARYNLELDADLLMVTNGIQHYYCRTDPEAGAYEFLRDLPSYQPDPGRS